MDCMVAMILIENADCVLLEEAMHGRAVYFGKGGRYHDDHMECILTF